MTLPKITGSSSCFLLLFPSTKSDDYGGVCGDSDVYGSGPQRITFNAMLMVLDRSELSQWNDEDELRDDAMRCDAVRGKVVTIW